MLTYPLTTSIVWYRPCQPAIKMFIKAVSSTKLPLFASLDSLKFDSHIQRLLSRNPLVTTRFDSFEIQKMYVNCWNSHLIILSEANIDVLRLVVSLACLDFTQISLSFCPKIISLYRLSKPVCLQARRAG